MKNFLIFLAGFVSGIALLIIGALIIAKVDSDPKNIQGLTLFEQSVDIKFGYDGFDVIQVVEGGNALALNRDWKTVVLFMADENTHYYDSQRIYVPRGKCVRQIGTYQYENKEQHKKTVPVVAFFEE